MFQTDPDFGGVSVGSPLLRSPSKFASFRCWSRLVRGAAALAGGTKRQAMKGFFTRLDAPFV